jgi:bifunctional DNA-binding transcriptional regulator/antitoxin component of YhaV-PrlF toxin-antitoxin module
MQYEELKVGKKGEVYTTKRVRKEAGIMPGSSVFATVKEGKVILERKPTVLDLLRKPRIGKPVSQRELSKLRKELSRELEER